MALSRTHRGLGDKNCPRCGLENVVKWRSLKIRRRGNKIIEQGYYECRICGWRSKQHTYQIEPLSSEPMKIKEARYDPKKIFFETYGRDPTSEEIRTFQEYIYLIIQGRRKMNLECEANEIKIKDRVTEKCQAAS